MSLREIAANVVRTIFNSQVIMRRRFPDFDAQILGTIEKVMPYTMTSPERIGALCSAVRYVELNDIPGSFVECGVYKGGSSMAAATTFMTPRDLYLFDTFEGMPAPTDSDRRISDNETASLLFANRSKAKNPWCYSALEEVRANMEKTGYPETKIHYVKGRVENTLPEMAPPQIAVLRLDTDWYESTRHELKHLYPRLSPGGILIIDDYGYWTGSRKAVDEYFSGTGTFLHRIDGSARLVQKHVGKDTRY
jgi:O-methyltransferase